MTAARMALMAVLALLGSARGQQPQPTQDENATHAAQERTTKEANDDVDAALAAAVMPANAATVSNVVEP